MGSLNPSNMDVPAPAFKPMDMEEFRKQAHQTVDFIVDYYNSIERYPVLPAVEPGYLRRLLPASAPNNGTPFHSVLKELGSTVLPGLTHWTSPNFFAYFSSTTSSAAIVADLLASALNPVAFNWVASPAVTEVANLVMDWMADLLKLPECFRFDSPGSTGGGVIQASTSEAVLCTLVAARESVLARHGVQSSGKLTAYASDQTHSTFSKACKIAGFSPANIRILPTTRDSDFALTEAELRAAMEEDIKAGLIPTYFCATVGTTSSTAVDPIATLSAVAAEYGAWIHVDAAYAGSASICPEFRKYFEGLHLVNSISLSPHKWLLTGLQCCCLWVSDRLRLERSLTINPEYLRNRATESGKVVEYKDWQIGISRPFRALKLFVVLRCYGATNLQSHIRSDVRLAKTFESLVRSDQRFEVVVPRRFSLVCFRLRPAGAFDGGNSEKKLADLNQRLLDKVNDGGKIYMTHTVLGGVYVLRFAIGATLTEERHVLAAWQHIKNMAHELLLPLS